MLYAIKNDQDFFFRIWLYQSTPKGLKNLLIRLTGTDRGDLESGYHFLVPINIFEKDNRIQEFNNWFLYSNTYLESILEIVLGIYNGRITSVYLYEEYLKILNFNRTYYDRLDSRLKANFL